MQLTKQQVTYIDDYLKHHKVKYWDIRIELLDHIVTKTEVLMREGLSFDKALEEVHVSFGNHLRKYHHSTIDYDIFVNGDGYASFVEEKRDALFKKYRRERKEEFNTVFGPIEKKIGLIVFCVLLFLLTKNLSDKVFVGLFAVLAYLPIFSMFFLGIKNFFKYRIKNSLNIQTAFTVSILGVGFLNLTLQLGPRVLNWEHLRALFAIMAIFQFVFTYLGLKVYRKSLKEYANLHRKLQSI
ncbi:MAG: hypothetical protein COB60_04970 [Flavobacteriaceae bacterium]|nr:MAG: hypothetical protein COB60_04970 [Flavobacteriaceae bacterium]